MPVSRLFDAVAISLGGTGNAATCQEYLSPATKVQ
jgi:hypothetical protein